MNFKNVEPDENFPIRKLESSPEGRWELGLTPMMYGVRIRFAPKGASECTLDYCCGANEDSIFIWFGFITALCFMLPEDISEAEVAKLFPRQTVKPISLDKRCQDHLIELARILRSQYEHGKS